MSKYIAAVKKNRCRQVSDLPRLGETDFDSVVITLARTFHSRAFEELSMSGCQSVI